MDYALQYIINFLLVMVGVGFIAVMVVLSKKYPFIGIFFGTIKKLFIVSFMTIYGGIIIFSYSFLAFIYIFIIAYFSPENYYFVGGEPLVPLESEMALLKLAVSYGILYFAIYIGSSLIYSSFRLNVWVYKALVFLTATITVIFGYPVIVHLIFPEITVKPMGAVLLIGIILMIMLKQFIRKEHREYNRYSHPVFYVIYRLIPWLKKGEPPGKDPYLNPKL